jgi:glucose-6-phosphate isomerase
MDYLQQLDMESNGKHVLRDGRYADYATGPVLWGGPGTDSQHSFFQLLHQGTMISPADFLAAAERPEAHDGHQRILMSHFLAQTEALMKGRTLDEARRQLSEKDLGAKDVERLAPHLVMNGNRPSNTILFTSLTPKILGSLVALYEHKVFVQGVIWRINSFDQWGVELGKQLAGNILFELSSSTPPELTHDSSTNALVERLRKAVSGR